MASIALSSLGSLVPIPGLNIAAQVVGGIAGSYIDSKWLGPLLGEDSPHRLKPYELAEVAPQQANEGAPIAFCLGPRCRSNGVLLWQGRTTADGDLAPAKGSAGAQSTAPAIKFYKSLALAYHYDERIRIDQVDKIIAEGKVIYSAEGSISISSDELSCFRREWTRWSSVSMATEVFDVWLEVTSPSGGPDMQIFESGTLATLTGFLDDENNGIFECLGVETDESTGDQVARFRNLDAVTNDESENPGSRSISQVLPETRGRFYDSITFYSGSPDQRPDPIIEEAEGVGTAPAFRGFGCAVFERLAIDEFGGRVPTMTFLLRESSTRSVASAIAALCERSDLAYPAYDVSRVTGTLSGLVIGGPAQAASTLAPILVAYDLAVREEAGRLVFFPRSEAIVHEIAESEYGTNRSGAAVEYFDDDDAKIPRELRVYHLDPANDLQQGKQSALYDGENATDIEEIHLGLVLDAQTAARRAHELLWRRIANARRMNTSLPPSRCYVREGDLVTHAGEHWIVLDRTINADLTLDIECALEWSGTDWSAARATGAPENEIEQTLPPSHKAFIVDIAPLRDNEPAGVYWTHAVLDSAVRDHGAKLITGTNSLTGVTRQQIGIEGVVGWADTVLPAASFEFPDYGSTVDVTLLNGTLASVAMTDVANGTNWAMIGGEIVGFTTATLIGSRRYRLSGFLRGRRGTDLAVGRHAIGEEFVLLDAAKIKHTRSAPWNILPGGLYYATAISPTRQNSTIEVEEMRPYIFMNGCKRPFSPYPVWITRDPVAQTASLNWIARSMSIQPQLSPVRAGTDWRIDLLSAPSGVPLIRRSPSFNRNATLISTFTAAQLTAVGKTWNGTLTFNIAEIGGTWTSEYREVTG